MKNVAVFFGGISPESEVSCITGVLTVNSIDKTKYNAVPIFIDKDNRWYSGEVLRDLDFFKNIDYKKIDRVIIPNGTNVLFKIKGNKLKQLCNIKVAINCLHGEGGEDGALAGIIKSCDIAFASPPLFPASLSMDKAQTKLVLKGLGVKSLPYFVANSDTYLDIENMGLNFPVIVKPNLGGSSIGINKATNTDELRKAVNYALRFGDSAIIEPLLEDFIEINCSAYMGENGRIKTSECERPIRRADILSFSDKYEGGGRIFPADISLSLSEKIKNTTEHIYRELGFFGIIRIDYMISNGEVILNEINSVPGSLAFYLFGKSLTAFTGILTEIIEYSEYIYNKGKTAIREFPSKILNNVGCKSGKTLVKGRGNMIK